MANLLVRRFALSLRTGQTGMKGFGRRLSSTSLQPQPLHNDQHPNVLSSDYPDIVLPDMPLHEYMFDKIAKYGKKICTECSVTGRTYTYNDIVRKSKNFGRALRKKLKLQRDDVVCVLLPNVPEFQIAMFGTFASGCVLTTMNPIYTPDEISRQLSDSGAKVLITLSELYPVIKSAIRTSMPVITINNKSETQTPEGTINFNELADSNIDLPDLQAIDMSDIALMPYSSGTTGLPKGVCLSHKNLLANLMQISCDGINMFEEAQGDKQDIVPAILPFFHIFGFSSLSCASMHMGAKLVTLTQFMPDLYAKVLLQHKPTVLFVVPPILIFLNAHPMITQKHLEPIRAVVSGAAPLGALDIVKFQEKAANNVAVVQGYGLSETSPAVFLQPHDGSTPLGSTGKILPSIKVKILPVDDPNGEPLGPNQPGECYIKGDNVMERYHNRPKETDETLIDGWLRTGDLFYYDENQSFFITDRIKELIKVKGFQVPPAELEEILRDHPDVGEAAVIGIPHDISGEVPRAYVVPKPNKQINVDALHEHVNKKVAEYKRLEGGIEITAAIPKNISGKILRRELKIAYMEANKQ